MITRDQALKLQHRTIIYHAFDRNADGTAVRARVNGAVKVWTTRPHDFQVPLKQGLKGHGYLTQRNNCAWCLVDPTTAKPLTPDSSIPVDLDFFLARVNDENSKMWDYRLISGIEEVLVVNGAGQKFLPIGLRAIISFGLVKEGAPQVPSTLDSSAFHAYIEEWVQRYRVEFTRTWGTTA